MVPDFFLLVHTSWDEFIYTPALDTPGYIQSTNEKILATIVNTD